jgi:hypothetical protein
MVLETVLTTLDETGAPHFAAMGVVWGEEAIVIRPYLHTRTLRHLRRSGEAVVNVTDDVLLFAKSALTHEALEAEPARHVRGAILAGACHWREVQVDAIKAPTAAEVARAEVFTRVVGGGVSRPFAGLCRAKHAVVEASILASRLRFLPLSRVLAEIDALAVLVDKTGGPRELEALAFIRAWVGRRADRHGAAR